MPKFGMKNGQFVMTPGGKWSSECGCVYQASDGSAHQEDFSGPLDPGWNQLQGAWSTSGGVLITDALQEAKTIRRTTAFPGSTLNLAIVEVEIFQTSPQNPLSVSLDGTGGSFDLVANWPTSQYFWSVPGNSGAVPSISPNTGDKLTIQVKPAGGFFIACFFVNQSTVHREENVIWSYSDQVQHGMDCSKGSLPPSNGGDFDNYTAQVDSS